MSINTRSITRRDREIKKIEDEKAERDQILQTPKNDEQKIDDKTIFLGEGSAIKSENLNIIQPLPQCSRKSSKAGSRKTSSSVEARRKKLELEAAEAKARIQMELIDKRLQADLAELDDEYSPPTEEDEESTGRSDVARWVERSQQELETQRAPELDANPGPLCPPAAVVAGTDGSIQQLACALKELVTTSVTSSQNANLLSRISTPRELPVFYGEPMDWLQFKQAFEESTRVCNFSEVENMWRLRRCLRGPAKDSVAALLMSGTSPDTIMSTLELQYGNPDVILTKILMEIKKLNAVSPEYHKDIVVFSNKIKNYVVAVRALSREEFLQGTSVVTVVLSKLPTILLSKWADYRYTHDKESSSSRPAYSTLDLLAQFLHEEALKITKCSVILLNTPKDSYKRKYIDNSAYQSQPQAVLMQSEHFSDKCRFCRLSNHKLTECKKFKRALRKERWFFVKKQGICYKCLLSRHEREACPAAACDVAGCGQPHHRLLHYVPPQSSRQNTTYQVQMVESDSQTETSETVTHINIQKCEVLLKVVPISIYGPNGIINTTALLDDGSTVSLISASLAERTGLRGRRGCLRMRGAWDNSELVCETQLIDLSLRHHDGTMFTLCARSVKDLNLPEQNLNIVNCEKYTHLQQIKQYLCNKQLKPEVLIGQDNYHLLVPLEVVRGGAHEPCATRTPLGWCLHGRAPAAMTSLRDEQYSSLNISYDDQDVQLENNKLLQELHDDVRRYFSIESMGISAKPRQNSEDVRAQDHLEQTSELIDGQWHVGLPWKNERCVMVDSFPNALARLKGVELKMKKNVDYAQRYKQRISHLFENNYAEKLEDSESTGKIWYLPHFGVDNPNKNKLRLVFDAAAKTKGLSLNDYLLKGPDLLVSLMGVMLRFREHRVAVTGDIQDMFLRVKIKTEDQHALRFLYRDNPNEPADTYVMTSLIFGANCSPFIAQFIKNKNARRFEATMPAATNAIYSQHYMDDYIDSISDEEDAMQLIRDVTYIHKQGNFNMRNWHSNNKTVLNDIPKETLGDSAVRFKIEAPYRRSERTLGLLWRPDEDTLGFDISLKKIPDDIINGKQRPTKRDILRVVMSIFDVYGFLAPFTINGKLIMQDTWNLKITWDDPVPDNIYEKWLKWIEQLKSMNDVQLPRYYRVAASASATLTRTAGASETATSLINERHSDAPSPAPGLVLNAPACCYDNLQLHIFCDASNKIICAVAYWRWSDHNNTYQAFIASKCRVASMKLTSIPRMELESAVLAARLSETIISEHRIKPQRRCFWSDSSTALHWIKNDARNYKAYVAHRLGEIDERTRKDEWRYVPSKLNVADLATKESLERTTLPKEWINGPDFLLKNESDWPRHIINMQVDEDQLEYVNHVHISTQLPTPDPTRFSSWKRLLRSTFVMLKFINKCRLTDEEDEITMKRAERLLLKNSQLSTFPEEINCLKNKRSLPKTSRILTLSPYLDEHEVLRLGGRIDAADDVTPETKRPTILDGRDYTVRLLVKYYHILAAHGNQETVVNNLKQSYCILRIRPTVKNVVAKCMVCQIRKCKQEIPRMGDLPKARVAHHQRPFTFCGVDLFGPMEVTVGRRREKRYGVLFTCLTVRAIHIEVVSSLTSDSFIMALRRMATRRGWPQKLFSDNGTNFRGAETEIKRSIEELDEEYLKREALHYGTTWVFIPSSSPHWGGAWERIIRSVKNSLKIVLKERAPRDETLNTFLAEVENLVNSRPLTHVSVEPGSAETLTPNHFLIGSSSNLPHLGEFNDSEFYLRKQWRIAQRLADLYWNRWVKEVLPDLLPRKKWNQEQRPLQVGDLVLIVDPNGPRNVWPRGVIAEVMPGKDGRVRAVKVKTKTGLLVRSAARIARIPIADGDECC